MTAPIPSESVSRPSASLLTRVDGLLEHAERLGRTTVSTDDYYRQVLGELADILEADSVAVWSIRQAEIMRLFDTRNGRDQDDVSRWLEPLGRIEVDRTILVPPGVGGRLPNATEFARCIACVGVAPEIRLALDVRLPAAAQRGENIADVVSAVASVIVEFHRGRQLTRLFALSAERDRVAAVIPALHATLEPSRIALVLANDAAAALRVDRISVLLPEQFEFRLEAVTAVGEVARRSNACRAIEQLVTDVRRQGKTLPWTTADNAAPFVGAYLQESGAQQVRVQPLAPKPDSWDGAVGAVVFEAFGTQPFDPDYDGIAEVCRHATLALLNAQTCAARGLRGRLLNWNAWGRSRRSRTIAAIVAGVVLALVLIPADFELSAHGQVQPVRRRHIYAPADGIVSKVLVTNGATVAEGDTLVTLRNPELDLDEQRIRGEIATANARLAAVRAARIDQDRRGASAATPGQLVAEEEELKQTLASLNRQLELVNRRLDELTLRAPLAGRVVRWDLIGALESRPVRQGQLLLQIVDPSGPWQLELRIPDRSVRHVLSAQAASQKGGLPVRFLFQMSPRTSYTGTLQAVNLATELDQNGELSTLATVLLKAHDIPEVRPGSSVIAKIHCGRRSLGYVWLRELLEFLQTRVFF